MVARRSRRCREGGSSRDARPAQGGDKTNQKGEKRREEEGVDGTGVKSKTGGTEAGGRQEPRRTEHRKDISWRIAEVHRVTAVGSRRLQVAGLAAELPGPSWTAGHEPWCAGHLVGGDVAHGSREPGSGGQVRVGRHPGNIASRPVPSGHSPWNAARLTWAHSSGTTVAEIPVAPMVDTDQPRRNRRSGGNLPQCPSYQAGPAAATAGRPGRKSGTGQHPMPNVRAKTIVRKAPKREMPGVVFPGC